MAALLKNQILKHLSKFTKNLSADKINLSTLKGEGELSNLELNEDILTQLLELPTWLRITKAVCNRVAVKIQWTKLKSQPICLYLDEVIVETETCEQPRPPNSQNQQTSGGKYGFVDRVMDGIYIHVNSVVVKLLSHKFHASLQLSRVKVQSMTPTWQTPSELRSTRIRDPARGEVLLFKEIEWQTTRIEATAVGLEEDFLTPLRLIANQAKIRICVKKRLNDCAIISSRLVLLLDDLLWVLTITQLKAALLYANSLKEVIERSAQQSKRLAAEKLKKQGHMSESNQTLQQQQRSVPDRQESTTAKYFSRFDVLSTSYHLITSRFDLHLCDDGSPAEEENRHWKISGGSMQITFYKLSIDFYPFHPAGGERKLWYRYTDNIGSRNPWVNRLFAEFRDEAVRLRKACESSSMSSSSSAPSLLAPPSSPSLSGGTQKKSLAPTLSHSVNTSPVHSLNQLPKNTMGSRSAQVSPVHQAQNPRSTRLLESCFVVKIEDVTVYMVSMPGKKRMGPNKLLCSDKRQLHLPPDMSVIHVEFTDYFFPEGLDYPVPHSNLYMLVNPVRVTLDFLTLLWSNVFLLTLSNSVDMDFGDRGPPEHIDVKMELLMPRIILPAEEKFEGQPDRPEAVQLQVSKLVVTNRRLEDGMSRDDLKSAIDLYKRARLFTGTEFPNDESQERKEIIPALMYDHADNKDDPYIDKAVKSLLTQNIDSLKISGLSPPELHQPYLSHNLKCNSLKRLAASDIWSASAEQLWFEFLGMPNSRNRPVPFVEAVPITVWLSVTPNPSHNPNSSSDSHTALCINRQAKKSAKDLDHEKGDEIVKCSTQNGQKVGHSPELCSSPPSSNMYGDHLYQHISSPLINNKKGHSHRNHRHHPESTDLHHPDSDQSGDGNSVSHSQQHRVHPEDTRPSRLSISGGSHSNESLRCNTNQWHHDGDPSGDSNPAYSSAPRKPYYKRDSRHQPVESDYSPNETHRGRRSSAEYESKSFSDVYSNKASTDTGYQQNRQKREKQFHREDSRSSSSPPLLQTDSFTHRHDDPRERRSKEKRHRHNSSSGSDRRDISGGRQHREYDGRYSAEGQVSSDSFRSIDERHPVKEVRRHKDHYNHGDMVNSHVTERRDREEDVHHREAQGHSFHRSRQSSSSSSEVGTVTPGDRRQHRSGSRDSRGSTYERYTEDTEARGSHRDDMEVSLRERVDRRSPKDAYGRRSIRDGSRESSNDRHEKSGGHCYERSSLRSKKRDQVDGIPAGRNARSHDRSSNGISANDDRREDRLHGRQHRSHSRGGDSDVRISRHERGDDVDSFRPRFYQDDSEYRSRQEEPLRPRHIDADCDNDRFSHTSHSSVDTLGRDTTQGVTTSEHTPPDHSLPRTDCGNHPCWPEDGNDCAWTQNNKRLPPEGCKSQEDICPGSKKDSSHLAPDRKICVLARVGGKLRIQLNHFQYLFLLRMSESFAAFQTDLSTDLQSMSSVKSTLRKSHLKEIPKPKPSPAISIPLVIKELEFAVVCPYQMHQRTFSDDFSLLSPFLQGMTTGQDTVFEDDGDGTCFPNLIDHVRGQRSKDDSSLKPFQPTITFKSNSSSQLENMSHIGQSIDTGRPMRGFTSNQTVPAQFTSDSCKKEFDAMSQSVNSIGKDSGIGIERKPVSQKQHHSRGGGGSHNKGGSAVKGPTDVKKAFTSAFSSFTDKLKNKMESLDDNFGPDDDAMSIRTDTSDDDFEHLSLDDAEEAPAFFHDQPPPDVASAGDNYSETGDPGDSVSMYAESSTTKGKEMVYVVLFKLYHAELMLDNAADQMAVKAQLAKIASVQLGNISYEDFQTRFQTAKGYLQEDLPDAQPPRYPICLKYEAPTPNSCLDKKVDTGHVIIRANDFSLQFKMSGLTCLADFAEDEKLPEVLPISLDITNFLLVLEEDRPSANVTSPGSVPLNIHIQQISVERGKDGIFYISGNPAGTPFTSTAVPAHAQPKPQLISTMTSPIMSPDGTVALLMASQNEAVLLRRQLEEVRRANRLYEHQILQWREMQDSKSGSHRPGMGAGRSNPGRGSPAQKRQSFTADSLSTSPSITGNPDTSTALSRLQRDEVDPARDELERENLQLQQRLARLEDDLLTLSKEKESLLQTLQLLQDELLASELKHRTKHK